MKKVTKFFLLFLIAAITSFVVNAQTTGTVFRDYNGNGTRQTSAPNEPLAAGVIVTAYDANDVIVASYKTTNTSAPNYTIPTSGTAYNGTLGSNTGFIANTTVVRLEFDIPNSTSICSVNGNYDFSGMGGVTYGSNVRFLASSGAARANNNFALNYPADFITSNDPYLFVPTWLNGNPLGGGTAGSGRGFAGFPYTSSGTGAAPRALANSATGTVYGNAYSKQANKIFLGAYLRRFSGFGSLGSGGIYIVNNLTSGTIAASPFYNMDANGYATRYNGVLAYGSPNSYTLSGTFPTKTVAYSGANDPNSGLPIGLGVIGTAAERVLSAASGTRTNDPAAWGQVGRVGLGDIEISDDGKYLFVVNLYDRKLYRLTLDNPTNPTGVTAVSSYALPTPPLRSTKSALFANTYTGVNNSTDFYTGVKGYQRPFGLKYYKGKVFVGATTTGENGGTTTNDNNAGNPEYTDLWAYVWQFDADATTPAFNTTPLLQEPQNYNRGTNGDGADESWKPWSNTHATKFADYNYYNAQPMFSGIEFDNDGTMIIGLRDRFGDQMGCANNSLDGGIPPISGTAVQANGVGLGHILRAYFNPSTCQYEMESNGKEGASSPKAATAGAAMGRGPGNGQFYYQANIFNATTQSYANGGGACAATVPCATYHLNLAEGSLVMLPGDNVVTSTQVDDQNTWSNGISWYNNTTGANPRDYQLSTGQTIDAFGKANALGDLEMITPLSPIEIGNRIWNDANGNGIQDAGEAGIAGVILELVDGSGNAVDSDPGTAGVQATIVTTDVNGNWYLTSATGTDATGINYGVALLPATNYTVRLATSGTGNDWDPTANGGAGGPRAGGNLVDYQLTKTDIVGTGAADLSDNDAAMVSSIPQVNITTGGYGQNNHNIDFGFKQLASLGDKVWRDDDKDGIQDAGEPGVAGVTVTLYNSSGNVVGTTVTDAYGNYLFDNLAAGTYQVGFTAPANYNFTTQTNNTDNTVLTGGSTAANGSDVNATTGRSANIVLSGGENERNIDAGLIFTQPATNSLGDKVWFDADGDGVQDAGEAGVSGVTVTLYASNGTTVIATTITDANGNYIFTGLPANTDYIVGITPPVGMILTTSVGGTTPGNTTTNSDFNTGTSKTATVNSGAAGTQITGIDAGLIQQPPTTASLGDKVWNDLDNDGLQDAGEPGVAGVSVELLDGSGNSIDPDGAGPLTQTLTTTNAFGNYIFNNLNAGSYQVQFGTAAGFNRSTIQDSGTDDQKDNDANTSGRTGIYILAAGQRNLSADAALVSTSINTAQVGDYVWFDANSNGTQDAGEPGVGGVTVTLYAADGITVVATTTTDANGKYQFTNLAAATYRVGFSNFPSGYSLTSSTGTTSASGTTNSDANPGTGKTALFALTAGESLQGLDAGLVAGVASGLGSLGNKVWWDIVTANNVQDAGEPGVPGVTVTLLDYGLDGAAGGGDDGASRTTVTNALGEYIFTGLPAGNYAVQFGTGTTLPAGATAVTQNSGANDAIDSDGAAISGGSSTTGVYNLAAGEDNLTVDLGLINTAKGALGNRVWFDNGSGAGIANDGIQNGTESGVAGVMVTLVNAAGQPVDRAGNVTTTPVVTTTDANGYYAFADLTAGVSFAVKFSNLPAGFGFTTKAGTGGGDDLESDADLVNGLTPAVAIVANTFNKTLDGGITSNRAGLGNYVWLDDNGNGVQDSNEPGVTGVTVTLYRPGFGLDGIAGNSDDALPVASMITDQSGQYLFTNLQAGTYEVEFSTIPGGTTFTQRNTPGDNGDNTNSDAVPQAGNPSVGRTAGILLDPGEMDLTVDAGIFKPRAVIGNYIWVDSDNDGIQDANELPVPGILVSLKDAGGNVIAVAVTDANGNYLFPNVAPGTYSLDFSNLPAGTSFTTANAGGDDNVDSDVIGTTITGIVVTTTTVNLSFDAGISYPSLGDKVWRDDDMDGIQDAGEPGVAGVTVTLYQNGTDGIPGTADDKIIGTTITDAYGNYLFDNLQVSTNAATSYNVGFTPPANYQFTTQTNTQVTGTSDATNTTTLSGGSTAANGSDANTTTGRTGSFWLAPGEAERGVDAGIIFTQPTTNSIGDKVWFDTDGDGVQDAGEAGVSGVTVTLYASNGTTVIATTVTDANGNYIFTGLPANTDYIVGITPPVGMLLTTATATSTGNGTTNSDFSTTTYKTSSFNSGTAGTQITGIDAGLIQAVSTTASLGDKVWNDLNGNGIQDAGEPGVAGVTVNLYRDSNGDGVISGSEASTPVATTVTDAFGNYIFNNLAASSGANGFYQVGFVAPSGYTLTTANAGSDETKDSDANTGTGLTGNYFLKAGERNLTVDAGLVQTSPAGTAKLGDKVWYDADADGVQDGGEAGVAGITVTLYNSGGTAIATTTTDGSGNYLFVNLAAGDYSVGFSNLPQGYSLTPVWSSDDANATNSDANPATGRTGTINLTAGETELDVDAGLVAGVPSGLASLGNKVWWDVVTNNNVQDAGEPGVPGVTVNLYRDANGDGLINGGEATTPFATTVTNALGEYIFTGLAAGTYQVGFTNLPTGSSTVTQNSGINDAIDSDGSTVTNATGASVSTTGLYTLVTGEENLTVDLGIINAARGALGNRVWFDNGAGGGTANDGIQNGTEAGVAGAMVTLVNAAGQPVDREGVVLAAGAAPIITTTDVNGYYAFADLLAGASFGVRFSNLPAGFTFTAKAGTGGGEDIRSDADLGSGLTPALAVVANTLNPNLDGGITSSRAGLGNYVWMDDNGNGIQESTEPGVAGVTVTLYRPGFGLDGIASTADDALPVASMITDQNGQYLFTNLQPGTYQVEFSTIPGGTTFTQRNTPGDNGDNTNSDAVPQTGNPSVGRTGNIVLSAGEMDLTIDAGLFKPRAVIGNYVWADKNTNGVQDAGEPGVAGVVVTLLDGGGNPVAVAITDANGGYLFPNVAPGTYSMSFTNLPSGTSFTTANQTGGGGNDTNDSDVVGTTVTGIVVTTSTVDLSFDAGIVNAITLPARLEFMALKQGNAAKLSWKVSYEENVSRYELEHSTGGINYTTISNQNRNGSSEYQYLDAQPASGINYYRVRIVDISGQVSYSEVRTLLFGKGGQILVFPNPVRTGGKVNIQLPESWQNKKITIEVMNQLGQVVSTQRREQASQVETIDAGKLSDGSYLLRMSGANGEVETRKIIVSSK